MKINIDLLDSGHVPEKLNHVSCDFSLVLILIIFLSHGIVIICTLICHLELFGNSMTHIFV